jgi:hypothetical protein
MNAPHARVRALVAACALAVVAVTNVFAADAPPASAPSPDIAPAERMLFMQPHMTGIEPMTELDYAVDYSGPPAKVSDTVRVIVMSPGNAKNDARLTDRTGNVDVPGGLPCNPVIIYFQQRVRLALAASPAITPVSAEALGLKNSKNVNARQIVIQPYLNDPNADRFAQYVGKRYTFVISDDVPGRVLLIRTEVPGAGNDFAHPMQ